MQKSLKSLLVLFIIFITFQNTIKAQLPCPNGYKNSNIIYIHNGNTIQNYDVTQPISATNPVVNTIPITGGGLAIANNLNGPGPSPTFYTTSGNNYWYWDGAAWVNTGHSAGAAGAVNIGGGGNYIFNLIGGSGNVYRYDGTGPATFLLTVPGFTGGGPYDLVGDCNGGFYILRTLAPGYLHYYDFNGNLLQSWTTTGSGGSAGGGFAIVNDVVYYHNSTGFNSAPLTTGPNLAFTPVVATIPSPSDMASCPVCDIGIDTVYYCQGDPPATLNSTGTAPITWTVHSGNAVITGSGTQVQVTASTVSVITATSGMVSTNTDSFRIIPPIASINAGNDKTLVGCGTYTDTLQGQVNNTTSGIVYHYNWAPLAIILSGDTTLNPVISQTSKTTYTLTVTSDLTQGGCTWIDSVTIDVDDFTPIADFMMDVNLGCSSDTVNFTNTSVTNPSGTPTYFWNFGDASFSTQTSPSHVYGAQALYNVSLVVTHNGCKDSITKSVDLNHPIDADFSISNTGTGPADSACLGKSFIISPITIPLAIFNVLTIDWYFGDGSNQLNAGPIPVTHTYANPGVYTIKMIVTDSIGCQDSISKNVFVDQPAYVEMVASPKEICLGETVYFIDSFAPNTFSTVYDFGDGNRLTNVHNPKHTYAIPGVFNVQFIGNYLVCDDDSVSQTITVNDYPVINLGPDTSYCPGLTQAIILADLINSSALLDWSTGETASSITVTEPGYYWARSSNLACTATDSIWVKRNCYLNIPNSFSPNGDGLNDYFFPRQLLSSGVKDISMKIFNRWGELIFQTTEVEGRGWDGKYGNKDQPMGVYVYVIDVQFANNYRTNFTGNVTLVR